MTAGRGGRGWRVLFFGSDRIAVATLDLLHRHLSVPPRHEEDDADHPSRGGQLRIDALHVVTTGGTGRWAGTGKGGDYRALRCIPALIMIPPPPLLWCGSL